MTAVTFRKMTRLLLLVQCLLAGRPWALSCRSPVLEQQAESSLAQRWATTTNT